MTAWPTLSFGNGKRIYTWLIVIFALIGTTIATRTVAQKVQAIEVRQNSSFAGEDFYRVYHIDNYTVYQAYIRSTTSTLTARIDSATKETYFEDSLISTGWKHRYFVFHRDSGFGYRYDPEKLYLTLRLPVDSGTGEIMGKNTFEKILSHKPDSSIQDGDFALREVYLTPGKPDSLAIRLVFSYSSRLNHLGHSLNPAMDSAKKMKLWKYEILIDEYYDKKRKRTFPISSLSAQMSELPSEASPEVLFYLNWYKDVVQWKEKNGGL